MPEISNQPIQPQTPSVVSQPSEFNWKSVLIAVFIGAVVIVAAVASLSYYINQSQSSLETGSVVIKKSTSSAKPTTPSAQKDETANWKVFEDGSFIVKYPPDWEIKTKPYVSAPPLESITLSKEGVGTVEFSPTFEGDFNGEIKTTSIDFGGKTVDAKERIGPVAGETTWVWAILGQRKERVAESCCPTFSIFTNAQTPSLENKQLLLKIVSVVKLKTR
jgi:hypothetical protein